jgi:hypothetical protein
LSEKIPGVGEEFINLDVLYTDGTLRRMSDHGYKKMQELYKRFGPKSIDSLKKDWFVMVDKFLDSSEPALLTTSDSIVEALAVGLDRSAINSSRGLQSCCFSLGIHLLA